MMAVKIHILEVQVLFRVVQWVLLQQNESIL